MVKGIKDVYDDGENSLEIDVDKKSIEAAKVEVKTAFLTGYGKIFFGSIYSNSKKLLTTVKEKKKLTDDKKDGAFVLLDTEDKKITVSSVIEEKEKVKVASDSLKFSSDKIKTGDILCYLFSQFLEEKKIPAEGNQPSAEKVDDSEEKTKEEDKGSVDTSEEDKEDKKKGKIVDETPVGGKQEEKAEDVPV